MDIQIDSSRRNVSHVFDCRRRVFIQLIGQIGEKFLEKPLQQRSAGWLLLDLYGPLALLVSLKLDVCLQDE